MSALIVVGATMVVLAAVAASESEVIKIIKEIVNLLVRTTSYTKENIIQIVDLYY
jgi:flagellar motor component MotA